MGDTAVVREIIWMLVLRQQAIMASEMPAHREQLGNASRLRHGVALPTLQNCGSPQGRGEPYGPLLSVHSRSTR